jgi:hypothetical protein
MCPAQCQSGLAHSCGVDDDVHCRLYSPAGLLTGTGHVVAEQLELTGAVHESEHVRGELSGYRGSGAFRALPVEVHSSTDVPSLDRASGDT